MDRLDAKELQAREGHGATLVPMAPQVNQAPRAYQVLKDLRDYVEIQETLVHQALMDHLEKKERLVPQAPKDPSDHRVTRVLRVPLEQKDEKGRRENLAREVPMVLKVSLVQLGIRDRLAHLESVGYLERQELRATWDYKDQLVLQGLWDQRV